MRLENSRRHDATLSALIRSGRVIIAEFNDEIIGMTLVDPIDGHLIL